MGLAQRFPRIIGGLAGRKQHAAAQQILGKVSIQEVWMSDNVHEVTDQSFEEEVLQSSNPVLVDFWAAWCAPCRMLSPTIDQIAEDFAGRAKVVKLNVDDNMETSAKYGIKGIPTLLLFKDGEIKDQVVGATSREGIARLIENQL